MLTSEKVSIIMEELNSQASMIPSYMEEYYQKAIVTALTRIDRQEQQETTHQEGSFNDGL